MSATLSAVPVSPILPDSAAVAKPPRIVSIDALRGFVMFSMIYVNTLGGHGIPAWMRHFHGKDGMTFVDLVFPAFLFLVGMSIPIALGSRLRKGEAMWKIVGHVILRTISLLAIGIMMVNSESGPDEGKMGWSQTKWTALMYFSAIFAFCSISPTWISDSLRAKKIYRIVSGVLRAIGVIGLVWLALVYQNKRGRHILTLSPFSINHSWYGILGLIGWSYLVASIVYLVFRTHRTALLGCVALLLCLYAGDHAGVFEGFWLSRFFGIGEVLGSHPAIATGGVLLASILFTPDTATHASRFKFMGLFIAGFAAAAVLTRHPWLLSKNNATPAWCLWACSITAALWLVFYLLGDVLRLGWLLRPLAIAGQNVLLAYLISEMMDSVLELIGLDDWYSKLSGQDLAHAAGRSIGVGIVILCLASLINRAGVRLKL